MNSTIRHRTRQIALNLLKTGIAVFLLGYVIQGTGFSFQGFTEVIKQTRAFWFIMSLPGVLLVLWVKSYRWYLLMRTEGIRYPLPQTYAAYLTSFFIGLLTPGRFGEIVKVYYVRNLPGSGLFKAFQTVISDRFFDLYFLLAAGAVSWAFIMHPDDNLIKGLVAGFAVGGLLVARLFIFMIRNRHQGFWGFVHYSLKPITGFSSAKNWGITLLAYFLYYAQSFFIAKSLGIEIGFLWLAAIMTLTSAILLLPVTFAGFGARELSLVMLLALWGIPSETAVAFSLLQFVSSFAVGGVTGMAFWFWNPVPMAALREDYRHLRRLLGKKNKE